LVTTADVCFRTILSRKPRWLARAVRDQTAVAERFELYVNGIELCNGYHELTDAAELQARIHREAAAAEKQIPEPTRLLRAMQHGLPACAGVALGFDDCSCFAWEPRSIRDVIPFHSSTPEGCRDD